MHLFTSTSFHFCSCWSTQKAKMSTTLIDARMNAFVFFLWLLFSAENSHEIVMFIAIIKKFSFFNATRKIFITRATSSRFRFARCRPKNEKEIYAMKDFFNILLFSFFFFGGNAHTAPLAIITKANWMCTKRIIV